MDYEAMSSARFHIECADAVAHLATQVMVIARETAALVRRNGDEDTALPLLEFTMRPMMECLGDLLDGLDAVEPSEDSWVNPVFEELHRRFPGRQPSQGKTDEA
jgi:hypothetical protein